MGKKLSVKIFIAFLSVSFASVGMLAIVDRFISTKNFESYLRYKDLTLMASFSEAVAEFYDENNGWSAFGENPTRWDTVVNAKWPTDLQNTPSEDANKKNTKISEALAGASNAIFPDSSIIPAEGSHPNLVLFDSEENRIAGFAEDSDDIFKAPIDYNGKTVGWVGISLGYKILHPLDLNYLKIQTKIFRAIDATVFGLSLLISFLLTRYLLSPIKNLIDASEALADRNFNTRTTVTSKDELGLLAMRFNTMAEKLETYERHQKQWLTDISHELRSPLAVLMGEIESFQDGLRKPDKATLSSLYNNAKFLSKIIEELHFLSLSDAGCLDMMVTPVKLLPILSQTIFLYKNRIEQSGIALDINLNIDDADIEIIGDYDRLKQLFGNILENSIVHTVKPGTLTVSQSRVGDHLHVFFEDSGPGVSEEERFRLFERLYRTDASRSRHTGGSGLGLAICKAIVEEHNGSIIAKNSERGGLKIEIHLPMKADRL